VCRTNPFACHNLFLAPPVMPLASLACDTVRLKNLVQPQTNHFALISSQPTTLPTSLGRAAEPCPKPQRPVEKSEPALEDAKATSRKPSAAVISQAQF
jgi:hypothetical protein